MVALLVPAFAALAMLRSMSSIAKVSALGNVFVFLALAAVLASAWPHMSADAFDAPVVWDVGGMSRFFGVAAFTFAGQSEVVTVYLSMSNPERYDRVLGIASLMATVCFGAVGACVFSAYGQDTQAIVFQNMSGRLAAMTKFCMGCVMYFSGSLKLFPAIQVIENLWEEPALPVVTGVPGQALFVTSTWQLAVRLVLALIPSLAAMFVTDFGFLVAICGAFCIGIVAFSLPPAMYVLLADLSWPSSVANALLAVLGTFATGFTTFQVCVKQFAH